MVQRELVQRFHATGKKAVLFFTLRFKQLFGSTTDVEQPERSPSVDLANLEKAEQQLDQFIERRAREAKDAAVIEELWKEQELRHLEHQREENREAWRCFYLDQAERLERTAAELAANHRARAAALSKVEGLAS